MKGYAFFCQYRKEWIVLSQKQTTLPTQLPLSHTHTHLYGFLSFSSLSFPWPLILQRWLGQSIPNQSADEFCSYCISFTIVTLAFILSQLSSLLLLMSWCLGRHLWKLQHGKVGLAGYFQLRPGTSGGGRKTSVSSSRLDCNRLRDREMLHLQRWFPLVKPSPLVLSSARKSTEKSTNTSVLPHICHRLKE